MKLLVLGGTSDARKITSALLESAVFENENPLEITYSVAGLVRKPDLNCTVISGGFSQLGGLTDYLRQQKIDAVLDATHPYAIKMSEQANSSCQQLGKHYWRFVRPAWQPTLVDNWQEFSSWAQLLECCTRYQKPFISTGQLSQAQLDTLAAQCPQVVYRTAALPRADIAENIQWVKAIGPFNLQDELALLADLQVDAIVSKNAGGEATYAKLAAARILQIDVLLLARPQIIPVQESADRNCQFDKINNLLDHVLKCVAHFNDKTQKDKIKKAEMRIISDL
jgi:precorrin-6A/cobalt-precorrin-6A reductase